MADATWTGAGPAVPFLPGEGTRAFVGRTGSAYASLGAGLVLVALGSEHLGQHVALGAGSIALGAAELGWAVLALRGPTPLPRAALGVLLGGAVGWLVAAVTVAGALGTADLAAVTLQLGAALLLAAGLRPTSSPSSPGSAGPWTRLTILAVGSLVAAAITVPGLASTDAGAAAPGMPGMGSMHHGHG